MSKPSDICIKEVRHWVEPLPFRAPLKFGGRVLTDSDILNVQLEVETRGGYRAVGYGSMPLGNVWAWPSQSLEPGQTAAIMKELAGGICQSAKDLTANEHPIDHAISLHESSRDLAREIETKSQLEGPIPSLAILVALSPFDAALHDAFGKANGLNSYDCLSGEFMNHDLSHYLDDRFRGEYLDRYTLRKPQTRMPLYHLVGALDPLIAKNVVHPIADGLPETLGEWIEFNGLTHLKIKLAGDNLVWDLQRIQSVNEVAQEARHHREQTDWHYSLDFNERCPNAEYLLEFLEKLKAESPSAYRRIQYIEQPTHRDLKAHPENRMHDVARIKPVVIDESLVDYESLLLSRDQGYSGVALKACKGQSEALLMAAAAQKFGMFLCVQDLTCPGASFLHSASLAARIPGVAAIEGNGRQYCPSGNANWTRQFPSLFEITDGTVGTGALNGVGLAQVANLNG